MRVGENNLSRQVELALLVIDVQGKTEAVQARQRLVCNRNMNKMLVRFEQDIAKNAKSKFIHVHVLLVTSP